jgi:GcrA cell cycle regulator
MSYSGRVWTDERVELLEKLWGEGLSCTQIARKMGGVTRNAIIGKVHRLGLPRRRLKKVRGAGVARPTSTQAPTHGFSTLRVSAQGKVFRVPPARPLPPAPAIFDVTAAKPWTERAFGECAFPVSGEGADTLSCCRKVLEDARYCEEHFGLIYRPQTPAQRKEAKRAGEVLARRVA